MDDADLRKKTETNVFAEFLSKVMPKRQASKVAPPPPPPPPPTPEMMRRGTQTTLTSASVTATPPQIKEFTYETVKQVRVEEDDDDDEDDYDEDDNLVEDEAREYGRENVGPVASTYLMPHMYKKRFLDTQYGIRKVGDIFMIGDSQIVVDTRGDITIKTKCLRDRRFWENR